VKRTADEVDAGDVVVGCVVTCVVMSTSYLMAEMVGLERLIFSDDGENELAVEPATTGSCFIVVNGLGV
jgi:hypothetical protein